MIYLIIISVSVIVIAFIAYSKQLLKLRKLNSKLKDINDNNNILASIEGTDLNNLKSEYEKTLTIETANGKKSNIPSSEIFSILKICKCIKLNIRQIDNAAGTLVGLGLLGTFLGLTSGVYGFDSSNTTNIQQSIQDLLGGMGTAFSTSLAGMLLSILFSISDKYLRNKVEKNLYKLTEKLDETYYIDDISLSSLCQEKIMSKLYVDLEEMVKNHTKSILEQSESLNEKLEYKNAEGEKVTLGNAVREILTENTEQSKALKSFSTDLAIELNNGFDEVLSRQMQEKILPLMENVDSTTKAIVGHIDKMAEQVSSPAGDMVNNLVDELKTSMTEIIKEFKNSVSSSATQEFENLALQLSTATKTMADFPNNMAEITSTLHSSLDQVKSSISEISNQSVSANSTAMQQMQEQIAFATGAISSAINEVKEVMSGITQTSQKQNDQMVTNLADASEKMSNFLNNLVSDMSDTVKSSIKGMTDEVSSNHEGLIRMQKDVTEQAENLLEQFTIGMDKLEKINESINGTMDMFQQAQGHITGSTSHLQNISGDMKTATEIFNKSQIEFNTEIANTARKREEGITSITKVINDAGAMSKEYAEQFEIIKEGLKTIFRQLQEGMNEYSKTVQSSTQKYLNNYSTSLTSTTDTLSSAIQMLNDVVEQLVEAVNTLKK